MGILGSLAVQNWGLDTWALYEIAVMAELNKDSKTHAFCHDPFRFTIIGPSGVDHNP